MLMSFSSDEKPCFIAFQPEQRIKTTYLVVPEFYSQERKILSYAWLNLYLYVDLNSQQGNWSQMHINYLRRQNLTRLLLVLQSTMQSLSFPVLLFPLQRGFCEKSGSFSSHLLISLDIFDESGVIIWYRHDIVIATVFQCKLSEISIFWT